MADNILKGSEKPKFHIQQTQIANCNPSNSVVLKYLIHKQHNSKSTENRRCTALAKILVTSAWPYINYVPHLGNIIGSVLSADVVTRYYRLKGDEVAFVSGSDEHGTPIEVEALRLGIPPKQLTDQYHGLVADLFKKWAYPSTTTRGRKTPSIKSLYKTSCSKSTRTDTSSLKKPNCPTAPSATASYPTDS